MVNHSFAWKADQSPLIGSGLATRKSEFRFLDFSAIFWKNFGQFSADISPKILETLAFVIFSADNLHLADFQHFLTKFRHIFRKKEVFGRLLQFSFCVSTEFWDKLWRKT